MPVLSFPVSVVCKLCCLYNKPQLTHRQSLINVLTYLRNKLFCTENAASASVLHYHLLKQGSELRQDTLQMTEHPVCQV